jgi:hypothetical protein
MARCNNTIDPLERKNCKKQAAEERKSGLEDCRDQFKARKELCRDLGGDAYQPVIDPADFPTSTTVDNPYFPLVPGTTYRYIATTDEGTEEIVVTVTNETKEIMGVTCVVVRDTVTVDGELVEDTFDWYAQDKYGNVWYFGEESKQYEDGDLVSLEGSWKAGVDGAQPGIIMEADPVVGDLYRQEFAPGEAEDMGEVLALGETVTVPAGTFTDCLKTKDFTPMEPEVVEHKYYAPGVGVVKEVMVEGGTDIVELMEIVGP